MLDTPAFAGISSVSLCTHEYTLVYSRVYSCVLTCTLSPSSRERKGGYKQSVWEGVPSAYSLGYDRALGALGGELRSPRLSSYQPSHEASSPTLDAPSGGGSGESWTRLRVPRPGDS